MPTCATPIPAGVLVRACVHAFLRARAWKTSSVGEAVGEGWADHKEGHQGACPAAGIIITEYTDLIIIKSLLGCYWSQDSKGLRHENQNRSQKYIFDVCVIEILSMSACMLRPPGDAAFLRSGPKGAAPARNLAACAARHGGARAARHGGIWHGCVL